jgi:CoA:oxalate CoA-transferase
MLKDMIVLEITDAITGPVAGLLLADFGAQVIKLEPPEWRRSLERRLAKRDDPVFLSLNRGKKSMVLDMINPDGRKIFESLAELADVVLSNAPPAVVKKLGLDYDTLGKINPRLICCNISGYGLKGNDIDLPAYDLSIQAVSGLMSITGEEGGPPIPAGQSPVDEKSGIMAALGILAAYIRLQKEGVGQQVDISMFDSALLTLSYATMNYYLTGIVPEPQGSATSVDKRADSRYYETATGYFVVASGRDNDRWRRVCKALGREELATDSEFDSYEKRIREETRRKLEQLFEPIFRTKTMEEWTVIFSDAGIPCAPVNTLDKALRKAEDLGRGMVIEFPLPDGQIVKGLGCPVKVGTGENLNPPPRFGQHTKEVMRSLLNRSETEIAGLVEGKVVFLDKE